MNPYLIAPGVYFAVEGGLNVIYPPEGKASVLYELGRIGRMALGVGLVVWGVLA